MELLVGGALLDRILDSPNRQFSEHQALDIMKQARARKHACARTYTPAHLPARPPHPLVHSPTHLPMKLHSRLAPPRA